MNICGKSVCVGSRGLAGAKEVIIGYWYVLAIVVRFL